jgi:2-polyprenyl-3-methyl-5-hydroxy-6-metoxy-1,4-benzoquinol methylase
MTSDDDGTLQAIESFYKIHRTNWTEAYSNTCETKPSFQLRIKYAIELAKNSSARLVLDAGCGTGELIAELARSGIPCDGIDASKEMLAIAKARLQSLPPPPPTNLYLLVATSNLLRTIQAPSTT